MFVILYPLLQVEAQQKQREAEVAKLVEGAKVEGKLIWWNSLKPEEAKPIIIAFEKKYPFLKVEQVRIHGTDTWERILRELLAKIVKFDACDIGGEVSREFRQNGLLERYDWTKAFDVRPEQLDKDQMCLYVGASVKGVGYNTKRVAQADLPKSWEDFLDPKWKGKFVLDTRPKTFVQMMPVWGEERVYEYLKKLVANKPIFRRGQTESIELMAAGEFPIIAGTYIHSVTLVKGKGAPVDYLVLDPVPSDLDEETVVKGAPHPNAAKLLVGWLATEGQKVWDQATNRGLPLPGFDTQAARVVKGKRLSLFTQEWTDRESELAEKAIKAMGRE